jgi:hypothetical protein
MRRSLRTSVCQGHSDNNVGNLVTVKQATTVAIPDGAPKPAICSLVAESNASGANFLSLRRTVAIDRLAPVKDKPSAASRAAAVKDGASSGAMEICGRDERMLAARVEQKNGITEEDKMA